MQCRVRALFGVLALVLSVGALILAQPVLAAGPAAKVADLAWMAGSYEGATGNGTLEENWAEPKAGSTASLVRATNGDATTMIELIVVEEEAGSLVLRLKQWNPGWVARSEEPQVMNLVESMPNKVVFEAAGEGPLKKLGYSREGDTFTVSVTTDQGSFDIPLKAK